MNPALKKHAPSHYWFEHCYATFMTDPSGPRVASPHRHLIASDVRSSDYPHQESTLGFTSSAIQAVFDATSVGNAQKIVGLTALDLFRMG